MPWRCCSPRTCSWSASSGHGSLSITGTPSSCYHSQLRRGILSAQSDQGSPHPVTHIQIRAGTLEICSSNSLLDKSICRYRLTHHMYTHGTRCGHQEAPRALGTSPSTPLRCPGQAGWDRESHCHLVGKGRIASALPLGTAGSKPPPCKIPGPAGEQDPEKPRSTWLGRRKGREVRTSQS